MASDAEREAWPTDPEFRRFAAKVADAVTLAISKGWVVTPEPRVYEVARSVCPLGATVAGPCYPNGYLAGKAMGINSLFTQLFACAFDGRLNPDQGGDASGYYRLGAAYRRWALERADAK